MTAMLTRKPDTSLTKRLFTWWKSDAAKNYTTKEAAEYLVATLSEEETTWLAQRFIEGALAQVQRQITVKAEKVSIVQFRQIVPDPFVVASGIPKALPKGVAAKLEAEKQAAREARQLSEKDRLFALEFRTRALSNDYKDSVEIQLSLPLLDSIIEMGDGTEKRLGALTADEWRKRISTREAAVVGNLASIGREKAYVDLIEAANANCLDELV